ncbi:MAG: metallophosphoesterase [Simkaniaceae bacterium]|nr:metallophosphoesterase [Candidatus Sacchlamyda saccharinae]
MTVWVLADLHLAFGNPKKSMEVFGPVWKDYPKRIQENWERVVGPDDLVLIPGDISWAMKPEEALKDLDFIDQLPGEKLIIRGNHDYWWPSASKLKGLLPPSIHFVQNNAFDWKDCSFGGARLWDTHEYSFADVIEFVENPREKKKNVEEDGEKIFVRDLERLKLSLECLNPKAKHRIALTHYPPIGGDLKPSRASAILEDYKIDVCVFGHLHNVRENSLNFGEVRGVKYIFASADYLGFTPIKVLD